LSLSHLLHFLSPSLPSCSFPRSSASRVRSRRRPRLLPCGQRCQARARGRDARAPRSRGADCTLQRAQHASQETSQVLSTQRPAASGGALAQQASRAASKHVGRNAQSKLIHRSTVGGRAALMPAASSSKNASSTVEHLWQIHPAIRLQMMALDFASPIHVADSNALTNKRHYLCISYPGSGSVSILLEK